MGTGPAGVASATSVTSAPAGKTKNISGAPRAERRCSPKWLEEAAPDAADGSEVSCNSGTAALHLAAMALGSLYREVASAHCKASGCTCGWRPCGSADVETLMMALRAGAQGVPQAPTDLFAAKAAGSA